MNNCFKTLWRLFSIKKYLDKCIRHWRKKLEITKHKEDGFRAECYIDAFQSVRVFIFGKTLPIVDEAKRKILKGFQPKTNAGPKPDPRLVSYIGNTKTKKEKK